MRALIGRSKLPLLAITAGILITISGCTSNSPVEPDTQGPSFTGFIGSAG
jgi:hypothetical protein